MADDAALRLMESPLVQSYLRIPHTGVYIVRDDGHIAWASPQMKEVTGRDARELVGRNGWDVYVPTEDLLEVSRFRALLSQADGTIWMRLRMPDGGREWYRVDCAVRAGMIVCAFRRQHDPSEQYLHHYMRPGRDVPFA